MKFLARIGIVLLICMSACIKKDEISLSDSLYLTPDYSIPIGPVIFSADDITFDLSIISDTSVTDSGLYILFNENYHEAYTGIIRLREMMNVDFNELPDMNSVRYMTFIFINDNYAPMEVYSQLYFIDNTSSVTDSLFEDGPAMFPVPDRDMNGNITDHSVTIHSVTFDTTGIDRLINTFMLEIVSYAKLLPNDSNIVQLDTTHYLKINTALRFGIDTDWSGTYSDGE